MTAAYMRGRAQAGDFLEALPAAPLGCPHVATVAAQYGALYSNCRRQGGRRGQRSTSQAGRPPAQRAAEVPVERMGEVSAGLAVSAGCAGQGGLAVPVSAQLLFGPHGFLEGGGSVGGVDVSEERGQVGGGVAQGVGDVPVPGAEDLVEGEVDVAGVPAGVGEAVQGGESPR